MKNLVHIFHVFLFSIFLLFVGKSVFAESNKLNDRDSVEMITIPEGYFLMGSKAGEGRPDERPQNKIYLDSPWNQSLLFCNHNLQYLMN